MRIYLVTLFLLSLWLSACQPETKPNTSINGVWESIGSGWILEIKDSTQYAFFDITSISCLPSRTGAFAEIQNGLTLKGDTLSLFKGVNTYFFTRTASLPQLCTTPLEASKAKDPLFNFEVFAETVKEHYAFLELNKLNWKQLYQAQKGKLTAQTSEAELYLVIEETLEKLNDNHRYLEAPDELYEEIEKITPEEEESDSEALPEYGDFQVAAMVAKHHLEEEMTEDSWLIQWGKLNDSIGFIQIKAMWLYADLDIPESMIEEMGYVDAYVKTFHQMYDGHYMEQEVQGVQTIMDRVMNDLSELESIVMDVRFNGGGQDAVSQEILSRFIPQKLQVATQQLRYGDQFSPKTILSIKGTPQAYTKPVYVLTSPQTGSAAESFAISTLAMDNAKRIGSATSGALSTSLEKTLPNGWSFAISNELFMDNQGNLYENKGIPADHELNYSRDRQTFFRSIVDDLQGDKESILKAIEQIQQEG